MCSVATAAGVSRVKRTRTAMMLTTRCRHQHSSSPTDLVTTLLLQCGISVKSSRLYSTHSSSNNFINSIPCDFYLCYHPTSIHTHTHTHPFNGPFSRATQVSRYQKGKTNLDFTEARDSEWQWHQLEHMQVCTSLQTTMPTPHHSVFYRPDALPAAQPTASKH